MTPNQLWKYANNLENIAKNMKGLALKARMKHRSLDDVSLDIGELFPLDMDSLHDIFKTLSKDIYLAM